MSVNRLTVVIDACVLCSTLKRHLILTLAEAKLFRVQWSEKILDETEKAITIILSKRDHSDAAERAGQARELMRQAFVEATVANYDARGKEIAHLPDEGDRHVIAAALKCQADIIVTENLRDFPRKVLSKYGIEAKSTDAFVTDIIDLNPTIAITAIRRMRLRLDIPKEHVDVLLQDLNRIGLKQVAKMLSDSVDLI